MLFLLLSYFYRPLRAYYASAALIFVLEIMGLNAWIAMHGAASNPFSSILLVPLVLGLMLLPLLPSLLVLGASIAAQVAQLYFVQADHHPDMMMQHAQQMIVGFVITCLLMAAVVAYFRDQLSTKSKALRALRERQMRDEQLLSIGTAAAQLTHDSASPIQTMGLLIEELLESQPSKTLLELQEQYARLSGMLNDWREVADDVRQGRQRLYAFDELFRSLQQATSLVRPETLINWENVPSAQHKMVLADRTLLPALTNVIVNACDAVAGSNGEVSVQLVDAKDKWHLRISNSIKHISDDDLQVLGKRLMLSQQGAGMGAVLSNASIEKWSGEVLWTKSGDTMITDVFLPQSKADKCGS